MKYALVIGCSYRGQSGIATPLSGSVNDAHAVSATLSSSNWQVRTLVDESATRKDIVDGFGWLVANSSSWCHLLVHFSGHGAKRSRRGSESEDAKLSLDESPELCDDVLLPHDYASSGVISGNTIHRNLTSLLPAHCHLTFVLDCCYGRGLLNLPHVIVPRNVRASAHEAEDGGQEHSERDPEEGGEESKDGTSVTEARSSTGTGSGKKKKRAGKQTKTKKIGKKHDHARHDHALVREGPSRTGTRATIVCVCASVGKAMEHVEGKMGCLTGLLLDRKVFDYRHSWTSLAQLLSERLAPRQAPVIVTNHPRMHRRVAFAATRKRKGGIINKLWRAMQQKLHLK